MLVPNVVGSDAYPLYITGLSIYSLHMLFNDAFRIETVLDGRMINE
jgi:hypothetical protein